MTVTRYATTICVVLVLAYAGYLQFHPTAFHELTIAIAKHIYQYRFFYGKTAVPAEIVFKAFTFIGAALTITFLFHRTRSSDKTARLSEKNHSLELFKSGVTLLSSESGTSQASGLSIMSKIAMDFEDANHFTATEVITAFITDQSSSCILDAANQTNKNEAIDFSTLNLNRQRNLALSELAKIKSAHNKRSKRCWNNWKPMMMKVSRGYFCGEIISDTNDYSNFSFNACIIHQMKFRKTNFENSELEFVIGPGVEFKGCNLNNAKITLRDENGARIPWEHAKVILGNFAGKLSYIEVIDGKKIEARHTSTS